MNATMFGEGYLDALGTSLTAVLSSALEKSFGPEVNNRVLGPISWVDLGVFICFVLLVLLVNGLAATFVRRKIRQLEIQPGVKPWHAALFAALDEPLYFLLWVYGVYLAATPLRLHSPATEGPHPMRQLFDDLFNLGVFIALFWIFLRLTRVLEAGLAAWTKKTRSRLDDLVVPLLGRSLRVIIPVLGVIFALPVVGLPPEYASVLAKGSSILMIGTVAWMLFQTVHLGEKLVLAKFDINAADNLHARKVYTQVHVLGKTIYVMIAIFTVASVLMLFEEVRRLGTSLLASAGVIGVIAGFAAQHTIANIFAGLQLALTQPIRLDDVVIVEGEWGRVEEMTLTYVVIHIWDDRRLIVPLSYFIEKPFQNWTRASSQLLGSVFLWVDYSLPVEAVRQAVQQVVENSQLWDRRYWNLQVTDANERAMQIRVLVTSADAGKSWDLRCEIREKLIAFIRQSHPSSLPKVRADLDGSAWQAPPRQVERKGTHAFG